MSEDPMTAPSRMEEVNFCDVGPYQWFVFNDENYIKSEDWKAVNFDTLIEIDFDEAELVKVEAK